MLTTLNPFQANELTVFLRMHRKKKQNRTGNLFIYLFIYLYCIYTFAMCHGKVLFSKTGPLIVFGSLNLWREWASSVA